MQDFDYLDNSYQIAKIDSKAPNFNLTAYNPKTDDEEKVHLEDLKGKWVVLFYYPADFTFVCPTELKDLAECEESFKKMQVEVLTVSTDSIFSHRAWVKHEKLMHNFPYKMLSDNGAKTSIDYNLLDEDTGMAARGSYIIDPDGFVRGIEITSGALGRNSQELLRKIEALQFMRSNPGLACPARWIPGEKTLKPSIKISGQVGDELEK